MEHHIIDFLASKEVHDVDTGILDMARDTRKSLAMSLSIVDILLYYKFLSHRPRFEIVQVLVSILYKYQDHLDFDKSEQELIAYLFDVVCGCTDVIIVTTIDTIESQDAKTISRCLAAGKDLHLDISKAPLFARLACGRLQEASFSEALESLTCLEWIVINNRSAQFDKGLILFLQQAKKYLGLASRLVSDNKTKWAYRIYTHAIGARDDSY